MRLLLLVCSMLQVMAVNHCIHCKFFRPGFMADKKFGECVKFPKVEDNVEFYVTGKTWPQRRGRSTTCAGKRVNCLKNNYNL